MWIVRLALRRPYSIGVLAFFILIMGILSIKSMIVDIFPVIDIPVVTMIWSYPGLSAQEMETKVVYISERGISTSVGGVEHIESQSQPGIGLLKIYFQKELISVQRSRKCRPRRAPACVPCHPA